MAKKRRDGAAEDPRWRLPVPPAPGELRLVQALLGTASAWKTTEELTHRDELAAWLAHWQLVPRGTEISRQELARVLDVREALRALLGARRGDAVRRAVEVLGGESRPTLVRPRFDAAGGMRYEVETEGFEGAVARVLDAVHAAQLDGSWKRLKLCAAPDCGLAFYDDSPGGRGKWCRESCGNRRNAAAYRRRQPRRRL